VYLIAFGGQAYSDGIELGTAFVMTIYDTYGINLLLIISHGLSFLCGSNNSAKQCKSASESMQFEKTKPMLKWAKWR